MRVNEMRKQMTINCIAPEKKNVILFTYCICFHKQRHEIRTTYVSLEIRYSLIAYSHTPGSAAVSAQLKAALLHITLLNTNRHYDDDKYNECSLLDLCKCIIM